MQLRDAAHDWPPLLSAFVLRQPNERDGDPVAAGLLEKLLDRAFRLGGVRRGVVFEGAVKAERPAVLHPLQRGGEVAAAVVDEDVVASLSRDQVNRLAAFGVAEQQGTPAAVRGEVGGGLSLLVG